ncbi:uncharacterized protein LOC125425137 [Sphaerodactylus townsendi]|uniref:uncharacterized protein LOC125425137 n=1 Tax=Sphaerodactylus townsendi TaxID=933632 RepID=UPI002025BBE6|nr:uncharacterized protein LOC125425137 [Sphaerodactylus townsendi]
MEEYKKTPKRIGVPGTVLVGILVPKSTFLGIHQVILAKSPTPSRKDPPAASRRRRGALSVSFLRALSLRGRGRLGWAGGRGLQSPRGKRGGVRSGAAETSGGRSVLHIGHTFQPSGMAAPCQPCSVGLSQCHLRRIGRRVSVSGIADVIHFSKTVTLIGRNRDVVDCFLSYAAPRGRDYISRNHARVIRTSAYELVDSSLTGVFVNDVRVHGESHAGQKAGGGLGLGSR